MNVLSILLAWALLAAAATGVVLYLTVGIAVAVPAAVLLGAFFVVLAVFAALLAVGPDRSPHSPAHK